eukprot:jgi/Mesvir1/17510/Mv26489-RA.1
MLIMLRSSRPALPSAPLRPPNAALCTRGTPSVTTVLSPAAFPARVIDKNRKPTRAFCTRRIGWLFLMTSTPMGSRVTVNSHSHCGLYARLTSELSLWAPLLSWRPVTIRWHCDIPTVCPATSCSRRAALWYSCGQALDPTGTHYLSCMGGQQNQKWYLYLIAHCLNMQS